MVNLKPFWRYYGGKWRAAPRYPKPVYDTIIEPFAGGAGYSLRYSDRNVILIDKYPVICEIWRYLIGVSPKEIMSIPYVEDVRDLPEWVPQGGRWLVGFSLNSATVSPCNILSSGRKKLRAIRGKPEGWTDTLKERIAYQVGFIKHWKIIEGDYKEAPDVYATWFIDPPYNNKAGSYYKAKVNDYESLGKWCKNRGGQVIVCENEGADWLPFTYFGRIKSGMKTQYSNEVYWYKE